MTQPIGERFTTREGFDERPTMRTRPTRAEATRTRPSVMMGEQSWNRSGPGIQGPSRRLV